MSTIINLSTDVPDPPTLTAEDMRRIGEEARAWRRWFLAETADMETMTADDMRVRVR